MDSCSCVTRRHRGTATSKNVGMRCHAADRALAAKGSDAGHLALDWKDCFSPDLTGGLPRNSAFADPARLISASRVFSFQ